VSHDLRAPLRAIDGFSKALLEDYARVLDDEGRRHLERVRRGVQRMGGLIDDLLMLARVSRTELRQASVDLAACAREVIDELRRAHPERAVAVEIGPAPQVRADRELLKIALTNLLDNAWKYTGKSDAARIEFGARAQDGETVYFVKDNGVGFDPRYADKLFGAFQRLHAPGEFPGSGIGLATVARIVHRHGGRVWAEGVPDHGATFYFTLGTAPARDMPIAAAPLN
jgi:signal transduction histidine kinase